MSEFLLLVALVALPLAYLGLCSLLQDEKIWWFTYIAYFFLFGTTGGWVLAIALLPSPLALACVAFLGTMAPVACLVSSVVLARRRQKARVECIAMLGGFIYSGFIAVMFSIGLLVDLVHRQMS